MKKSVAFGLVLFLFVRAIMCLENKTLPGIKSWKGHETVMLIEIYSSGARAPVNPNFLEESWARKTGRGKLSRKGMLQQLFLGIEVRQTFKQFFKSILDMKMVKVFSSGRSRSLLSALSHNHGLFPGENRYESPSQMRAFENSLKHQPPRWVKVKEANWQQKLKGEMASEPLSIPLEVTDQFDDFMFLPRIDKACSKGKKDRDSEKDYLLRKMEPKVAHLLKNLTSSFKAKGLLKTTWQFHHMKSIDAIELGLNHVVGLWDVVSSSLAQKGQNPHGLTNYEIGILRRLASASFMAKFHDRYVEKLYLSKIAQKIKEQVELRINSDIKSRKEDLELADKGIGYLGFSGDDDTVAAWLNLIFKDQAMCHIRDLVDNPNDPDNYSPHCFDLPPFASSLMWEVGWRESDGTYRLRLLYNNQEIPTGWGGEGLKLSEFIGELQTEAILEESQFDYLCGNRHYEIIKKGGYGLLMLVLICLLCIVRAKVLATEKSIRAFEQKKK